MDILKEKFYTKCQTLKSDIKNLLKEHGDMKLDEVKISQAYGGMRGIKSMIWETSLLDANEGIRFRGYSIPELQELLPKAAGGNEPLPEGIFWLMLVDELPSDSDVKWLTEEWRKRSGLPQYLKQTMDCLPAETHPMTQFTIGIMALQNDSIFAARYAEGMSKDDYWDATYEDTMNLLAKLPELAAYIYRRTFFNGDHKTSDSGLDWGGNFAHLLGNDDPAFLDLMRIYLTIHADHEGGNASAHTTHLVGSTLSDAYLSLGAGMNALAGPLHGLANQEVIKWIFEMLEDIGTESPSKEQIAEYVERTLSEGKVIPGYGHAVLRKPDPRYMAQKSFAEKNIPDSSIVQVVWKVFEVVPPILQGLGKVANPWPNVDAHSGALLVHYNMKEYDFYTVLFGVSRAMGVLAQLCWSRGLGLSLERPKSLTTGWIKDYIARQQNS
ncbi:MAG: citrate (Si)-synthase [Saprospiraceae bacterium]|nr:citrate (Si)-synthase [Saprospiraceae bacterium]